MTKRISIGLATSAALLLIGCGGGSGGDTAVSQVSLTGKAVDELILNGIVNVKKSDNKTILATGRTDSASGSYTIKTAQEKSVVVNVTCDDKTTLEGGKACPAGLNLNAVTNIEGDAVTINVSPLTEVIYQVVVADGVIDAEEITLSLAQMSVMMGVNPNREDPTEGNYDLIIKSFHAVADNDPTLSIVDVINAFAEDAKDGKMGDSPITLALATAMKAKGLDNSFVQTGGNYTFPTDPKVLSVKDFVQQIRTQGTVMKEYLTDESDAIGKTLDGVAMDADSVADYVGGMADLILDAYAQNLPSISGKIPLSIYSPTGIALEADITLVKVANTNKWTYETRLPTSTPTVHKGVFILPNLPNGIQNTFTNLEADFDGTLPVIDRDNLSGAIKDQTVTLHIVLNRQNTVTAVDITNCTITDASGSEIAINSLTGVIDYVVDPSDSAESIFNYVKIFKIDMDAKAGDYEAQGVLTIPTYVTNKALANTGGTTELPVTYYDVNVGCSIGNINVNSAELTIDGNTYYPDYYSIYGANAYFGFDQIDGHWSSAELDAGLKTNVSCLDSSAQIHQYSHVYNDTDESLTNSGIVPKIIEFEGTIKNTSQNRTAELNGKISVDIKNAATLPLKSFDNMGNEVIEALELKVKLDVKHTMINRPDTSLNLMYETIVDNAAAYHTLFGSFGYNNTLLTINGKFDKTTEKGSLVFTDAIDIRSEFIFTNGDIVSGDISNETGSLIRKAGKVEASIEDRNGAIIIKYADGTFETIF